MNNDKTHVDRPTSRVAERAPSTTLVRRRLGPSTLAAAVAVATMAGGAHAASPPQARFSMALEGTKAHKNPRLSERRAKIGPYIGGGSGSVSGPDLKGKLVFDLYEDRMNKDTPDNKARIIGSGQIIGVITTDDGATIHFETRGIFQRHGKGIFTHTAVLQLKSEDARYGWLDGSTAIMEGYVRFTSKRTAVHRYEVRPSAVPQHVEQARNES